jgi:hypothetical protein
MSLVFPILASEICSKLGVVPGNSTAEIHPESEAEPSRESEKRPRTVDSPPDSTSTSNPLRSSPSSAPPPAKTRRSSFESDTSERVDPGASDTSSAQNVKLSKTREDVSGCVLPTPAREEEVSDIDDDFDPDF